MAHPAVPPAPDTTRPTFIVDLDTPGHDLVPWTPPAVVDGEIVTHPPYRSPLDADEHGVYPTVLRGGIVTDPTDVGAIAARVAYGKVPWWRRLTTRTPVGW